MSASTGSLRCDVARGPCGEVAEPHARELDPVLVDVGGGRLACDDDDVGAGMRERGSDQAADAAGSEHCDLHAPGGSQNAGVHDRRGVDRAARAGVGRGENVGALAFIPGAVRASDGVVVRDRAAAREHLGARGGLDRLPTARSHRREPPARPP